MTPSELAALRVFLVVSEDLYTCTSQLAPHALERAGRWWESAEAERARVELDAELAKCKAPSPLWSVVQDLVHFVPYGASSAQRRADGFRANTVLRRRDAMCTGAPPSPPCEEWHELDTTQKPSALFLTHCFTDMPVPGATLTLRTLYLEDQVFEVMPEEMLQEVFEGRTPALSASELLCATNSHFAPTTDVEVNGATLTAAQLAALSQRARRAVDAARRMQLLSTVRGCLGEARWAGGFLALRHLAEELTGMKARLWTEPLAVNLIRSRTDGIPTFPLVQSFENWAGAHLQVNDYEAAAPLMYATVEAH